MNEQNDHEIEVMTEETHEVNEGPPKDLDGTSEEGEEKQTLLAKYFPTIRSRLEVLVLIHSSKKLSDTFHQWTEEDQELFLDYCTGARGLKILYDGIFKEIFNPEVTPERLESLLSLILKKKVKVKTVLPNDSVRLGAESSLLYTDIIVELEDRSLSNVEVQKIGYAFPGQRSACYSADHLLRQYKRVRGEQGKKFNYRNIKNVYTIVFFEQSPKEFHKFPNQWLHVFSQKSNTGLSLELLQEYYFISLDIFKKTMENKCIDSEEKAWLSFLSFDTPERIEELISRYPEFKAMYEDIYEVCRNMEKVMNMYSKELQELDHNTVMYMIDEMQLELNQLKEELGEKRSELEERRSELKEADTQLEEKNAQLKEKNSQLEEKNSQLEEKNSQLEEKNSQLEEKNSQLEEKNSQLEEKNAQLKEKNSQLEQQAELIRQLQLQVSALMEKG